MIFAGFLLFFDPPKPDARETLAALAQLGVQVKIITGDNRLVARHLAETVGLPVDSILPASEMEELRDEALWNIAERITIFAEVDPNQKERIILALRKMGHVVGYMGDGINDAPALHAADIGISVEQAVDWARGVVSTISFVRQELRSARVSMSWNLTGFPKALNVLTRHSEFESNDFIPFPGVPDLLLISRYPSRLLTRLHLNCFYL